MWLPLLTCGAARVCYIIIVHAPDRSIKTTNPIVYTWRQQNKSNERKRSAMRYGFINVISTPQPGVTFEPNGGNHYYRQTCIRQLPSLTARLPDNQHVGVGRQDDARKIAGKPSA